LQNLKEWVRVRVRVKVRVRVRVESERNGRQGGQPSVQVEETSSVSRFKIQDSRFKIQDSRFRCICFGSRGFDGSNRTGWFHDARFKIYD